ncbi:MAG: DNA replication/repair protein RecF [Gammaproteobacteria bacterium]|nr:DNA replication/repair protein RecF [Gammaproteobacteria bacterium]
MRFVSLKAINLRCFAEVDYRPGPGNNLIYGANGSGKTSLLEGLYIASIGKSFLSSRASDLVLAGSQGLSITAEIGDAGDFGTSVVVVKKQKAETQITLDGQTVSTASALARNLPVLVMNSRAPDLLGENPSNRRALLDRSLFHVEHGYIGLWKEYRHALRQRNELLRNPSTRSQAHYWEQKLAEAGEAINGCRLAIVEAINRKLASSGIPGLGDGELRFDFSQGWNTDLGLAEQLRVDWERDSELGYTMAGPHRADLSLWRSGRAVSKKLSRGQSKMVVCLTMLAIAQFIKDAAVAPVLLFDDLSAELDDMMLGTAVSNIQSIATQCFFTAIKPTEIQSLLPIDTPMFHVERKQPPNISA